MKVNDFQVIIAIIAAALMFGVWKRDARAAAFIWFSYFFIYLLVKYV
jgi:hypothetical protein